MNPRGKTNRAFCSGAPGPDQEHLQCRAIRKSAGVRCRKWALKDSHFCQFHFGRVNKKGVLANSTAKLAHMPRFYKHVLRKTLQETFEDLLAVSPTEQLQVYEELALMRMTAVDVVKLYDIACSTGKPEVIVDAGATLRSVLSQVGDMCGRASQIEAAAKDKIPVHQITFVVNQIVRIAFDTLPLELATVFEERVRDGVKLPSVIEGTTLTPDDDVESMDDTVPSS